MDSSAVAPVILVLGVVIAVVCYRYEMAKLKFKAEESRRKDVVSTAGSAEIEQLRERVAVLERLVTSEDRRVAMEIDKLARTPQPGA